MTPERADDALPRLGPVPLPAPDMPADLRPQVVRNAVRCVLLDDDDRILLFHTKVPSSDPPEWWDLPGGGLEPGETYREAAVREIAEETGLVVAASEVSEPAWRRSATWTRKGVRRVQHELVVTVRVEGAAPEVDRSGWTDEEVAEYADARWWTLDEITAASERFYPGRLPTLLPRYLAGEFVDEPFEWWN